jgi:hypothetical protein
MKCAAGLNSSLCLVKANRFNTKTERKYYNGCFEKEDKHPIAGASLRHACLAALNPPGKAQAPGAARKMMQPGGPKVLDDGRVTFTLNAPEADKVALNIHPGYRGHVWDVLRKNPRDFAPLLFR